MSLINWTPLLFGGEMEAAYQADRALSWARLDRAVIVPWGLLWLSIVRRHWNLLSIHAIFKSFCCFTMIVSPCYLQLLLGRGRYSRYRLWITTAAQMAYVFHPAGGLYRDGLMSLPNTALGAATLFVRLAVGSRTLFWLVLAFGYQKPPHLQIPLDLFSVSMIMWLKPSSPFCTVMQHRGTQELFRSIANSLPLLSFMPIARPELVEGADVCNPLIAWTQVGIGYLLPMLATICIDIEARRRFAARMAGSMTAQDIATWAPNKRCSPFSPWVIMALVYPHLLTALWYVLMWGQLDFSLPSQPQA